MYFLLRIVCPAFLCLLVALLIGQRRRKLNLERHTISAEELHELLASRQDLDQDVVIYCTCPGDETSRHVLARALAMHLCRIKLLKGGLSGWKAKGYSVVPYDKPFYLDVSDPPRWDIWRRGCSRPCSRATLRIACAPRKQSRAARARNRRPR
jgi:rhodanese-related sulfurtransferase